MGGERWALTRPAGAIPYLWPKLRCPIYATRFAANLAQAKLKDAGFRDEVPANGGCSAGGALVLTPETAD